MSALAVRSERVVLPDGIQAATIQIQDGRIHAVTAHGERTAGVREIDAGQLVVLPGLVDSHVHMNDPGRADWEGADHATRAAAAGGVTTLIDMPLNSVPPTTTLAGFHEKQRALRNRCHVDVGFWGGVVPGNSDALEPLAAAGVLGYKCFLCPSGVDEFEHVSAEDLRTAMPVLAALGLPLLAHAERPERLLNYADGDPRSYATWLRTRPSEAETSAIELLIQLSAEFGTRVHIVHLATGDALHRLQAARSGNVRITVETCPHYLTFAAEGIVDGATAFKCAPPIRERGHRERLWEALTAGEIDLVATDHSPAPPALKSIEEGDFLKAWGGIASLQLGLAVVWTGANHRGISIERLSKWMSEAPAHLAGLYPMKGTISAGSDADLVIWDPEARSTVDPAALHHRHPVTPYAGMELQGVVRTTMLRGEIVYKDGQIMPIVYGRLLGSRS